MSPRKNHRRPKGVRPAGDGDDDGTGLRPFGLDHREDGPDGAWIVRTIAPVNAVKPYRCPGCDHEIAPRTGHVVAWPADRGGAEDRRHWHTACWRARLRRAPTRRWS